MTTVRRLYCQTDRWARNLSQTRYAALLGASSTIGALVIGFLISRELLLFQALTMGFVMFTLEIVFEKFHTTEE
jgi:hypothetical protein